MRTLSALIILALTWFTLPLHGQPGVSSLDKTVHDFGELNSGDPTYADFVLTNTGKEDLYLLKADFPEDCRVRYSLTIIPAGKQGVIRVKYNPERKGKFERSIKVFTGASARPMELTLKGNVRTLDEGSDPSCPDFSNPVASRSIQRELLVEVQDRQSGQPISRARIRFGPNPFRIPLLLTNSKGESRSKPPIGLYSLLTEAPGYYADTVDIYIGGGLDKIVVQLDPMPKPVAEKPEEPAVVIRELPQDEVLPADPADNPAVLNDSEMVQREKPGELPMAEYGANNVVFLIDVSSSMVTADKLPLLKESMKKLLYSLRSIDKVSIVTYATDTRVILESVPADKKELIAKAIDDLQAAGSTQGGKGIREAYRVARARYINGGNNQIFLATDGDFNLDKNDDALYRTIADKREEGITLSVVGFGRNTYAIIKMKKIAASGGGSYIPVAPDLDYEQVLLEEVKLRSKR